MKKSKKKKKSFNNLKASNNQRKLENMILKSILLKQRKGRCRQKSIKLGRNNNSHPYKMSHNSNTHKVITIPLQEAGIPNIPKINIKKKCSVFKMPNPNSKLNVNNNYSVKSKNKKKKIINS